MSSDRLRDILTLIHEDISNGTLNYTCKEDQQKFIAHYESLQLPKKHPTHTLIFVARNFTTWSWKGVVENKFLKWLNDTNPIVSLKERYINNSYQWNEIYNGNCEDYNDVEANLSDAEVYTDLSDSCLKDLYEQYKEEREKEEDKAALIEAAAISALETAALETVVPETAMADRPWRCVMPDPQNHPNKTQEMTALETTVPETAMADRPWRCVMPEPQNHPNKTQEMTALETAVPETAMADRPWRCVMPDPQNHPNKTREITALETAVPETAMADRPWRCVMPDLKTNPMKLDRDRGARIDELGVTLAAGVTELAKANAELAAYVAKLPEAGGRRHEGIAKVCMLCGDLLKKSGTWICDDCESCRKYACEYCQKFNIPWKYKCTCRPNRSRPSQYYKKNS